MLKLLDETRVQADLCLGSISEEKTEEISVTINQRQYSNMGGSSPSTQAPHTQAAFGTQISHAIRPRVNNDEPLFMGARQLAPVLMGNTQRKALRPGEEERNKLLSLLDLGQKQRTATAASAGHQIPTLEPRPKAAHATSENPTRNTNVEVQSTARRVEQQNLSLKSPPPAHKEIQEKQRKPSSLVVPRSSIKEPKTLKVAKRKQSQDFQVSDCPWMVGLEFSRESLMIPLDQQRILQNPESWHHPQPGVISFPGGNVPIQILRELNRLADEKAAAEEDPDTDEEDIDPSPDSVPPDSIPLDAVQREIAPSPGPTILPTQDDGFTTTQVSWSVSPSPEPPQRPPRSYQELPPDSSFDHEVVPANKNVEGQENLRKEQSKRRETNELPTPSKPAVPPSSPPVVDLSADTDEDMDMEVSIPQGLGEDAMELVGPETGDKTPHSSPSPGSKAVVQVVQTPYSKGRQTPVVASNDSRPEKRANPSTKDALSSSVVKGSLENERDRQSSKAQPSPAHSNLHEQIQLDTQSTKRKHEDSPSKGGKRQIKRREIKLVGFGGEIPTTDQLIVLSEERAASFRKFKEERKSNTSIDQLSTSPKSSNMDAGMVGMDTNQPNLRANGEPLRRMSPRHASLYDEPATSRVLLEDRIVPHSNLSTRPKARTMQPEVNRGLISSQKAREQPKSPTAVQKHDAPTTVYQSFKEAYPEYTGGTKHFANLCVQMYELDQEDKMVPKWQWDDYIVRNRTDYKDYAMDCADKGEDPEPYHRFYKDSIRDTLYGEGIIGSRRTLLKAFGELGLEHATPESPKQSMKSPRKKKPSRASLPGAFHQPGEPALDQRQGGLQRDRLRHSLPTSPSDHVQSRYRTLPQQQTDTPWQSSNNFAAKSSSDRMQFRNRALPQQRTDSPWQSSTNFAVSSSNHMQSRNRTLPQQRTVSSRQLSPNSAAKKARATSRLNRLQCLSSDKLASPRASPDTTGDRFRDYLAAQRTTSGTGGSKVSSFQKDKITEKE